MVKQEMFIFLLFKRYNKYFNDLSIKRIQNLRVVTKKSATKYISFFDITWFIRWSKSIQNFFTKEQSTGAKLFFYNVHHTFI